MAYSLSIWLDDDTAIQLEFIAKVEERKRGQMVKVLIRRAFREQSNGNNEQPKKLIKEMKDD